MNYIIKIMRNIGRASKEDDLRAALTKRGRSIEALKAKIEKLDRENQILRSKNEQLRSKVSELYGKNKEYAVRLRKP